MRSLSRHKAFENIKEENLIPYQGTYVRNCSPCTGLRIYTGINAIGPQPVIVKALYPSDIVKTYNELRIPTNDETMEIIIPKENISLTGFYTLPHTFLNTTLTTNTMNLYELYKLSDYIYSYKPFRERFNEAKKVSHLMNNDTKNIEPQYEPSIHS